MIYLKFVKEGSLAAVILVMAGMWGSFGVAADMNMPKGEPATEVLSFQEWCEQQESLSVAERHTVSVLLAVVGTSDCQEATELLLATVNLDLGNRGIEDIKPLSSLRHLQGLNLSFNAITDITPLSSLEALSFLLLSGNQIREIAPLGNLTGLSYVIVDRNQIQKLPAFPNLSQLRVLDLQNNPLVTKKCPVLPAPVCLFSNDALDLLAQGEQEYQQGNFEAALGIWSEALKVYQESGDRRKQADTLNRIGDSYSQLSEYGKSIMIRRQALTRREELRDLAGIGQSLTSLADSYEKLGQYRQGRESLEAALQNMAKQEESGIPLEGGLYKLPKDRGQLYNSLARVQNKLGEHDQALVSAQRAMKDYHLLPDGYEGKDYGIRATLEQIGITYGYLGQNQPAESFLNQSLVLAQEIGDQAGMATTLAHLGDLGRTVGMTAAALDFYRQGLALTEKIGDRAGSGKILNQMGALFLSQQDYRQAIASLQQAITIWESLRPGLRDGDKVSLFETQVISYEQLQIALIAAQQGERALAIAERGRARAFVELLAARLGGKPSESFSAPNPPTLAEIRRIAQEQQATLVEYSLLGETLYIWVIQPNGVIELRSVDLDTLGITLEDAAERTRIAAVTGRHRGVQRGMNEWVQETRSGVQAPESQEQVSASPSRRINRRLKNSYQLLIEPIADLLPSDPNARIIFIPQGSLFLIPFAALQDEAGLYLIEKHTPLTAPSIQVLDLTRQRSQQLSSEQHSPLVVGNPEMPSLAASLAEEPKPLDPLPGAEKEAMAIAQLLGTQALIGAEATEETITQQMEKASLIHLATHGLLDELQPLGFRSPGAIALTPTGDTPATDGWLTSEEILDLNLTAQLVVLSACNTGRGEITGDGIVGLSRSLIAAGTPSVLVSLWAVPDAPTSELMRSFYQELSKSGDRAIALRQAMLTTLKTFPDPSAWAAFILVGEAMTADREP